MLNKSKILEIIAQKRHEDWKTYMEKINKEIPECFNCEFEKLNKVAQERHLSEARKLLLLIKEYIVIPEDVPINEDDLDNIKKTAESVLGRRFIWTDESKNALRRILNKGVTVQDIIKAFLNLRNEPDHWKITNNRSRSFVFWFKNSDRIYEMLNCHLKGESSFMSKPKKEWTAPTV